MADYFIVFYHFHSKFVGFITKFLICLKFFGNWGIPNNFMDVVSLNSWVESTLLTNAQLNAQALSQTHPHI